MLRWLAKFIYFKLLGWKLKGNKTLSKNAIKKAVIIVVPHTSWHDFYIGLLLRKVINIKTNFIGKKELFVGPIGWYLRRLGGRSIDRNINENKVESIAQLFKNHDEFRITLAPEGTRKKVKQWKTGFYYIAKTAQVPILMIAFDFAKKECKLSEPFYPTDNHSNDFKFMMLFYKGVIGKIPEYT